MESHKHPTPAGCLCELEVRYSSMTGHDKPEDLRTNYIRQNGSEGSRLSGRLSRQLDVYAGRIQPVAAYQWHCRLCLTCTLRSSRRHGYTVLQTTHDSSLADS